MDGSSLARVKQAVIDQLKTNPALPTVEYPSPTKSADVLGDDGSGRAIWWGDEITATLGVPTFQGTDDVVFDEVVVAVLNIQVLGRDTNATQAAVDLLATAMLGQVVRLFASKPDLGLLDDSIQTFTVLPLAWTYHGGVLGTSNRAARYELQTEIKARLKLADKENP